jgi:hypothetical protein
MRKMNVVKVILFGFVYFLQRIPERQTKTREFCLSHVTICKLQVLLLTAGQFHVEGAPKRHILFCVDP